MGDLTIQPARACASAYAEYIVESESDPGTTYLVALDGERPPYCGCPSFKWRTGDRITCKHITRAWKEACLYHPQGCDRRPLVEFLKPARFTARRLSTDPCPICGGPTVAIQIGV